MLRLLFGIVFAAALLLALVVLWVLLTHSAWLASLAVLGIACFFASTLLTVAR